MKRFAFKSPTRVDLAGGTIDLWPISAILGGTCTVNMAIEIFTYAEVTEREDLGVEIELSDIAVKRSYPSLLELLNDLDPAVSLIRVVAEHFKPSKGFRISTKSESPVGGGLGGSSSLCVSIIKCFEAWLGLNYSPETIVELAHNIEARVLGLATGTQDYIPALLGGVCMIDYTHTGMKIEKANLNLDYLHKRFFLAYTGKPHHSGLNNWDVLKKFIEKEPSTTESLKGIRRKAEKVRRLVKSVSFEKEAGAFKEIFQDSYQLRTKLSPMFTSPEIEKLKDLTLKSGADAVKILGAGGGGCVMVWTPPDKKHEVLQACQNAGFKVMDVKPCLQGSQAN
jgi:D-glycero-alpha-D-manno-heptose-7-phosphate kinase